jgi:hypothetical protein
VDEDEEAVSSLDAASPWAVVSGGGGTGSLRFRAFWSVAEAGAGKWTVTRSSELGWTGGAGGRLSADGGV